MFEIRQGYEGESQDGRRVELAHRLAGDALYKAWHVRLTWEGWCLMTTLMLCATGWVWVLASAVAS